MKEKSKSTIYYVLLSLLLVVFAICVFVRGSQKEGYHVDELYSYGLANGDYLPFMHFGVQEYSVNDWMNDYATGDNIAVFAGNIIKDFKILKDCDWKIKDSEIYKNYLRAKECSNDTKTTTWVSGEEYKEYLTVSKDNPFNLASVYYNQRGDVHPPLFYLLLNFISSFFPGVYSKWFGIVLNATAVLLSVVLLYLTVKNYLGGELPAILNACAYALSFGAMSSVVFLRMYALLTFMVILCVYIHLYLMKSEWKLNAKTRFLLIVSMILGYLTHYYFVIFALGIFAVSVINMFTEKKWKQALSYFLTLALSGTIGIIVWPFSIRHVFFGYRGKDSFSSMSAGNFAPIKIKVMAMYLAEHTVWFKWWMLLIGLALLTVALVLHFVKSKKGKNESCKSEKKSIALKKILLIFIPCLLYLSTVPQMVPFLTDRYIMCLFPWVFTLFIAGLFFFLKEIGMPKMAVNIAGIVISLFIIVFSSTFVRGSQYLYTGGQETESVRENTDCIYVIGDDNWNKSAEDSILLSECRMVSVAYAGNVSALYNTYAPLPGTTLMLIIRDSIDVDEYTDKIMSNIFVNGTPKYTEVSREGGGDRVKITYFFGVTE